MKAKVIPCGNRKTVSIQTEIGEISGIWCSPDFPQERIYFVEYDSNEIISPTSIQRSALTEFKIACERGGIILNGYAEEVENSILYLRLLDDIVMLDLAANYNYSSFLGHYVEVFLSEINLYDTGII